ncbi:MAG: porin family protein [Lentimicrobium sp.]|jgi:hypothetical protein|nr:porin family protein [Lentimicrobium sp.]
MKTKLFSLTMIFTLVVSLAAFAQGDSKASFGIIGGVNFQNLNGKDMDGDKLENDMIVGFHAGINVQLPIAPQFYFQPGFMFSTKGGENSTTLLGTTITSTYKLSYIELPLNLVYKGELSNGYVLLGFGPYVAYGIGGKATIEGGAVTLESDIEFKKEVETGDPLTTSYFKPLDAGANIFFGYELASGIFAQLDAQLGLININPDDKRLPDNKLAIKNTGFGLSLGYRF